MHPELTSIESLSTAELVEFSEIQVLSFTFQKLNLFILHLYLEKNIFCAMSNKILNSLKCVLFKTPICLADIPLKTSYLQVFIYFDSIYI